MLNRRSLFFTLRSPLTSPTELSFGAEELKRVSTPEAGSILGVLLNHPVPMVREGALLGINRYHFDGLREKVLEMASTEETPSIKALAATVIRNFTGRYPNPAEAQ